MVTDRLAGSMKGNASCCLPSMENACALHANCSEWRPTVVTKTRYREVAKFRIYKVATPFVIVVVCAHRAPPLRPRVFRREKPTLRLSPSRH